MASNISLQSDNLILVENVFDQLGLLTDGEVLAATGTVTLYSDESHSTPVSGATNLTLTVLGSSVPATFYASVVNTVSLTEGSTYYALAVLTATDVSASQTVKISLEETVTAAWKS